MILIVYINDKLYYKALDKSYAVDKKAIAFIQGNYIQKGAKYYMLND